MQSAIYLFWKHNNNNNNNENFYLLSTWNAQHIQTMIVQDLNSWSDSVHNYWSIVVWIQCDADYVRMAKSCKAMRSWNEWNGK